MLGCPQLAGAAPAPVHVERVTVGRSVHGTPIVAVARGEVGAPHVVLVVGCIHGDECAGLAVIRRLLHATPPPGVRLWIVRTVNPDGRRAHTRQNARGVDLNRNFPYRWRHSTRGTWYGGPRRASERETRATMKLVRLARPDVTIWYHQHMRIVEPGGYRPGLVRRYARIVRLPLRTLPAYHGTATSWQNHLLRRSTAFVVELPAGSMHRRELRRHVRAVLDVARRA